MDQTTFEEKGERYCISLVKTLHFNQALEVETKSERFLNFSGCLALRVAETFLIGCRSDFQYQAI